MSIYVLDQDTINKISAGEVIERPMAVVKELVENSIDAGANSVTVEIKDGGKGLIRITDNGSGIDREDIRLAFTPHATSKIRQAQDLLSVSTLGFRGEALASVSSVSMLEMLTKTREDFSGWRYVIEGGEEKKLEAVGCPDGTTFIIRNLFYNTPARLKFLKTAQTEAGYISGVVERLALSHPDISFRIINHNQSKLHTSGNGNLKDVIYNVYGRDIANNLLEVKNENEICNIYGFIAKPVVSRGNRSYINYFINGRYIKSQIVTRAIEEAYSSYTMQHRYPFTALNFEIAPNLIDVNVHPQKMEIRFANEKELYSVIYHAVADTLSHKEFIPEVSFGKEEKPQKSQVKQKPVQVPVKNIEVKNPVVSPVAANIENERVASSVVHTISDTEKAFNKEDLSVKEKEEDIYRVSDIKISSQNDNVAKNKDLNTNAVALNENEIKIQYTKPDTINNDIVKKIEENIKSDLKDIGAVTLRKPTQEEINKIFAKTQRETVAERQKPEASEVNLTQSVAEQAEYNVKSAKQETLFDTEIMSKQAEKDIKIIGQVFSTYWILQYGDSMFMIDQHAAHEKVLYERFMKKFAENEVYTQLVQPPVVLSLSMLEQQVVEENMELFEKLGYNIENFGGKEYMVTGVPAQLPDVSVEELLIEIIDSLVADKGKKTPEMLLDRIATMSCKAAVKGGSNLSVEQAQELLKELMMLENPYNCPHGRPTMIKMTKKELEKKFKRIV